MPRGPRLDAPGALHHVTARGIERREIFLDDADREAFLARLDRLSLQTPVVFLGWALMPNHVHFVAGTELGVLSRFMARLNTGYALHFNRRHGRVGHLFQNRFWSQPIEGDPEGVVEYVHLNPVRGGLTTEKALPEYRWCGHGARVGARPPRTFERPAWPRAGERPGLARIVAEECVRAGLPSVAVSYGRSRAACVLRVRIVSRALRETPATGAEVARALGIARSTVSEIARGVRVRRS